jgi:hypothetical protein
MEFTVIMDFSGGGSGRRCVVNSMITVKSMITAG